MNNNIEEFYQHNDLFYKQTKSSIRKIKIISNIAIFICLVVTYILMEENDFFRENFLEDFFLIFNKPRNFFLFFVSI